MTALERSDQKLGVLRDALAEAQMTVRAYDTKAQIVGVGYIFALGIVSQLGQLLPNPGQIDAPVVAVSWLIVVLPILLFGYVLYPTRKTAPSVEAVENAPVEELLYVAPARHPDVRGLLDALSECTPENEYAFEVIKVSKLRELKRKRFLRALFSTLFAFAFLFASQIMRGT